MLRQLQRLPAWWCRINQVERRCGGVWGGRVGDGKPAGGGGHGLAWPGPLVKISGAVVVVARQPHDQGGGKSLLELGPHPKAKTMRPCSV